MIVDIENNQNSLPKNKSKEIELKARAVSRGVAFGRIVCLHGRKRQFFQINLENHKIENELCRFRAAVKIAKNQIISLDSPEINNSQKSKISIFDAHLMMLEDDSLISKIEQTVKNERVNAEWAIKIVTDDLIADYKKIEDVNLRERYIDLEDVSDRLQNALGGGKSVLRLEKNLIVAAKEINPSTLIELSGSQPLAIITERGGWTSHTFILAREMNLPAVTGLKSILRRIKNGDEAIVDGYHGRVILHPNDETARKFQIEAARHLGNKTIKNETIRFPLKTLDGTTIKICANLDFPSGYTKAKRLGARGIGLYRSESLFNQHKGFPSEDEQTKAYQRIARLVGDDSVGIRTFDLSVEHLGEISSDREQNPALGLRGIRFGLWQKKQFVVQIRALLRAAAAGNIDIILPMISDVSEILETKKIIADEKLKLKKSRIKCGNPRIGAMIEVPATIMMIDEICRAVDFLNLGTNDLVQYLLAVDRDNETVSELFRTLHPAVLRSIKKVLESAEANGKPIIICGEMAGSPVYATILIGLGARELSMNPNSMERVARTIAAIALEEATEITAQLLQCETSDQVERLVFDLFQKKWSHLFSHENLPSLGK